MKTLRKYLFTLSIPLLTFALYNCENSDDVNINANISINEGPENGDINGDFTGNGGDHTGTYQWPNNLSTANYNADITASAPSSFNMIIQDADGNTVLDKSLLGGTESDSFSGVTMSGTPGTWSVTITLIDFKGDGSFSISAGN